MKIVSKIWRNKEIVSRSQIFSTQLTSSIRAVNNDEKKDFQAKPARHQVLWSLGPIWSKYFLFMKWQNFLSFSVIYESNASKIFASLSVWVNVYVIQICKIIFLCSGLYPEWCSQSRSPLELRKCHFWQICLSSVVLSVCLWFYIYQMHQPVWFLAIFTTAAHLSFCNWYWAAK